MSDFKTRLLLFIKHLGIGQTAFEKEVGLARGAVNNIRHSLKTQSIDKIILRFPELNEKWLIKGEGEMLLTDNNDREADPKKHLDKKNRDNSDDIIEYYDSAKGQQGRIKESLLPPTKQDISGFIKKSFFKNADWVIRGIDDSMLPNYPPNAYIGLRKIEAKAINPGSVYAIDVGSDLLIKRVYYKDDDPNTGILICLSDNTTVEEFGIRKGMLKYPPKILKLTDVLSILKVTDVYNPNEIEVI